MVNLTNDIAKEVEVLMRHVANTELLPRFQNLAEADIERKKDKSVVTIADKKSEEALTAGLREIIPQALVVGEEAYEADPSIMDYLKGGKLCWIIDPLDGTSNFAAGRKNSGIIVALVQGDMVRAGWILNIHEGTMTRAIAGKGAYHEGKIIRAKQSLALDFKMAVAYPNASYFTSKEPFANQNFRGFAEALIRHMNPDNIRAIKCSAIEYTDIALGKAHFGFHHFNTPWDHAAGHLIINEAGGHAGFIDGEYRPSVRNHKDLFLFYAHNRQIADRLQHIFRVMKSQWENPARTKTLKPNVA